MLKENSQIKIHMYNSQNEEININQDIYILKSKDGQLGFENEDKKEFTTLSSFDSRVEFEDLSNNNIYYYSHKTDKIQQSEINLTKTYINNCYNYWYYTCNSTSYCSCNYGGKFKRKRNIKIKEGRWRFSSSFI